MTPRAPLEDQGHGQVPTGPGWFVVNLDECRWTRHERFGAGAPFEGATPFEGLGIHVHVLAPGQPACLYHSETVPEAFLVLAGQGLLVVEEEEVPLRAWDFVHCPPGTRHVFVGAGDGPCVILMTGVRAGDEGLLYPASPVAARHGASADEETPDPRVAYANAGRPQPIANPWRAFLAETGLGSSGEGGEGGDD